MAFFRKQNRSGDRAPATITETAPCQKALRLHMGLEAITPIRSAVVAEFQREAALPGFRKGKAPADLVERQHAKSIHDEVLHRATKQALEQAAKEHQLKPVGPFELTKADFSETDGLRIEATVEVEPAFALADYKGVALTRQSAEVTPKDLEQALASLQDSMAQLVPAGEGKPKERQVPPLDQELAKDLGFDDVEKLKTHVEAKLREQKQTRESQRLEAALCDALITRHAFEVPPRMADRQRERLARDFKARLLLSGMTEQQVEAEMATFTDELRTSAERHVKLAFILDRIAAQESIGVAEDELLGRLWQLAQRWHKDPSEVRRIFDANQLWPSVMSSVRQEKTITKLLSLAAITDGSPAGSNPGT